ncbi:hypothetical protein ABBQ38_009787 [Trebouxia sp. C0009 RCD-2024]
MLRTVVILSVFSSLSLSANAFSRIVAFGDSLTDDCTMGISRVIDNAVGNNQPYPGVPYYKGCIFSNGPPYPVVAAGILNVSLTNYAKGGATSGAVPAYAVLPAGYANNSMPITIEIPSTLEQVVEYLDDVNGTASSDAIYFLFVGSNDYFPILSGTSNATVEDVLEATAEALDMLYQAGARLFYTQLLPFLGNSPRAMAAGPEAVAFTNAVTTAHNSQLAALIPQFAAFHLDASIILFNFEAFTSQAGAAFGITDLTTPCYNSSAWVVASEPPVCANPDSHAYWDEVHPSARVHQLWGQAVAAQLMPFASTTSTTSRKLLAQEDTFEGSHLGTSRRLGLPF